MHMGLQIHISEKNGFMCADIYSNQGWSKQLHIVQLKMFHIAVIIKMK